MIEIVLARQSWWHATEIELSQQSWSLYLALWMFVLPRASVKCSFMQRICVLQVENGKNAMPAWQDRLDEDEIIAVANYVFKTATDGAWS
jgi:hypothetical protein